MDIDKEKLKKELENIKYGIYDKYYHNIFKYLSEHTFEREDAKRILQIENYKITDDFVEIKQNNVKFIIDYKNQECYIGILTLILNIRGSLYGLINRNRSIYLQY